MLVDNHRLLPQLDHEPPSLELYLPTILRHHGRGRGDEGGARGGVGGCTVSVGFGITLWGFSWLLAGSLQLAQSVRGLTGPEEGADPGIA